MDASADAIDITAQMSTPANNLLARQSGSTACLPSSYEFPAWVPPQTVGVIPRPAANYAQLAGWIFTGTQIAA